MKNVIYKIRNTVNGKFYVGSTVDARVRFQTHRRRLRKGSHQSPHMQAAWNKYGEECFIFEIVEHVENGEDLLKAEQKWLDEHAGKPHCYNWATDASAPMRGKKHSNSSLLKLKGAAQKVPKGKESILYGVPRSEETRKKIGDAQRGVKKGPRTYTPEGLEKARENMKRNAVKQDPKPIDEVLAKFPQEVQDRYDFSNAIYTGALNRIEGCVCPCHGVFSQYAAQFRKGRGCPSCGGDKRAESKRKQMKEFWASGEGYQVFRKPK